MKRSLLFMLMCMVVVALCVSCGSRSSNKTESIDGTYVYQDGISRSVVTISGDKWTMKTQFGAPGYYYGNDAKYDSGKVKGNILYYSGIFEYGEVTGRTLRLAGRSYYKQ